MAHAELGWMLLRIASASSAGVAWPPLSANDAPTKPTKKLRPAVTAEVIPVTYAVRREPATIRSMATAIAGTRTTLVASRTDSPPFEDAVTHPTMTTGRPTSMPTRWSLPDPNRAMASVRTPKHTSPSTKSAGSRTHGVPTRSPG